MFGPFKWYLCPPRRDRNWRHGHLSGPSLPKPGRRESRGAGLDAGAPEIGFAGVCVAGRWGRKTSTVAWCVRPHRPRVSHPGNPRCIWRETELNNDSASTGIKRLNQTPTCAAAVGIQCFAEQLLARNDQLKFNGFNSASNIITWLPVSFTR